MSTIKYTLSKVFDCFDMDAATRKSFYDFEAACGSPGNYTVVSWPVEGLTIEEGLEKYGQDWAAVQTWLLAHGMLLEDEHVLIHHWW